MAKKGGNLSQVGIKPVNLTTLQQEPPRHGIAPFPNGGNAKGK
jgi:hypothetical protein